jgi:hypothetical protein
VLSVTNLNCLAINLEPQNAVLRSNRSAAYFMLGDFTNALADSQLATELDPYSFFSKGIPTERRVFIFTQEIRRNRRSHSECIKDRTFFYLIQRFTTQNTTATPISRKKFTNHSLKLSRVTIKTNCPIFQSASHTSTL